jgi:hypothetical protein
MNSYGQMLLDHYRKHRPTQLERIADPIQHFATVGEEIQATVTDLRGQILGPTKPGENLEEYRHRSYQALRQAEELVLHEILAPPPEMQAPTAEDPAVLEYRAKLGAIGKTTSQLARDWTEAPAG